MIVFAEERVTRQNNHGRRRDRKSTRLNSSHTVISYAVFCLKKKKKKYKIEAHTIKCEHNMIEKIENYVCNTPKLFINISHSYSTTLKKITCSVRDGLALEHC